MTPPLARTPLNEWHRAHQARMANFAGWEMPIQYTTIVDEHLCTRSRATLFDISHMGRLRFDGQRAAEFLDSILTRRVVGMKPGRARYALVTDHEGGILDDVLVYYLEKPSGEFYHLLVVNASNREKILNWIAQQDPGSFGVTVSDRTFDTAMIAVQGPQAVPIVDRLVDADVASMKYYTAAVTQQMQKVCIVSRTGYTGEDGCELIVRAEVARQVWENVLRAGREIQVQPAGLGARDTLRLEAGMPLYGHELSEEIDPFQARLGFAVDLEGREFCGRESLHARHSAGGRPVRVGLQLEGRRAARQHYAVYDQQQQVGEVTSGTFSPTFQCPLAMAYVQPACAHEGRTLDVDIRGQRQPAQVVSLPFYKRPKC